MIKFYKHGNTGIRKVAEVDSDGNKKVVAIIGQVKEMLSMGVIFSDNTDGNMEKWIAVNASDTDDIAEFNTLEEAKRHYL